MAERQRKMRNELDHAAARELYLFSINSREIYTRYLEPIQNNFIRKAKKGVFDTDKAARAYVTALRESAKLYCRYFGGDFRQCFTVATREEVAREFVRFFENEKDYLLAD